MPARVRIVEFCALFARCNGHDMVALSMVSRLRGVLPSLYAHRSQHLLVAVLGGAYVVDCRVAGVNVYVHARRVLREERDTR